jgi:diguanylate cyclase (GGDEF)-like protein/PAS domain S-box-containing protein
MSVRTALAVRDGAWRGPMLCFLAAAAALIGAYLAVPTERALWWALLGALSVAAVAAGVAVHRPAHRAGWVLLGCALAAEAAGDLAYHFAGGVVGSRRPFPSAAEVFYLLQYPLAIAGMVLFTRRDPREHRAGTLNDVLIIATGMATLTWAAFVIPYSHLPHTPWWHKAILITYMVGDATLLTLAVRLPLAGRLHSPSVRLLLLGAVGLLFSDADYAVAQLHLSWHPGQPADLGWAVFYISWAAAALSPSMAQVAEMPEGRNWAIASPRSWAVLLGLVALVGPALLIFDSGTPERDRLVAAYCALLFGLVLLRLVRAMDAWQESVRRQEDETHFRAVVADASDAIVIVGPSGSVRYASPAAEGLFGDALEDGELAAGFSGPDRARVARAMRAATTPEDATAQWPESLAVDAGDGRLVQTEARWSDLRADPAVGGIVVTLRDVTEQRRLQEELRSEARSDPLTGLANRRGLRELLQSGFAGARSTRPGGLLMIDLDDFKEVNDTLGHPVGDELLAAVAVRIGETVRAEDVVARLGGDEFAVLLGPASPAALEAVAQRLVGAFDSPFHTSAGPLRAACSVGLAIAEPDRSDPDELLRNADLALNEAKDEGKHRWRRYDARLLNGLVRRSNLRAALDRALREEALALCYQPVVQLETGRITGFEALVRCPHPQQGLLCPDEFTPLAEQTGQIFALGEQVMRTAFAQATAWNAATPGRPCRIGINTSVHQLMKAEYADSVLRLLDQAGLDPALLVLEITEGALIERQDSGVRQCLSDLRSLGVHVALDDFGTGYASLISLHDLPIDILKIDRSFLTHLSTSPRMAVLLRGISAIADRLGLRTIAEGLTTAAQRDALIAMNCRLGQGRFYSDPLQAQQATTLWTGRRHYAPLDPAQGS